jgi:hypothetical protein
MAAVTRMLGLPLVGGGADGPDAPWDRRPRDYFVDLCASVTPRNLYASRVASALGFRLRTSNMLGHGWGYTIRGSLDGLPWLRGLARGRQLRSRQKTIGRTVWRYRAAEPQCAWLAGIGLEPTYFGLPAIREHH